MASTVWPSALQPSTLQIGPSASGQTRLSVRADETSASDRKQPFRNRAGTSSKESRFRAARPGGSGQSPPQHARQGEPERQVEEHDRIRPREARRQRAPGVAVDHPGGQGRDPPHLGAKRLRRRAHPPRPPAGVVEMQHRQAARDAEGPGERGLAAARRTYDHDAAHGGSVPCRAREAQARATRPRAPVPACPKCPTASRRAGRRPPGPPRSVPRGSTPDVTDDRTPGNPRGGAPGRTGHQAQHRRPSTTTSRGRRGRGRPPLLRPGRPA